MSAVLGLARREVRARRMVLLATGLLSLLALALRVLPAPAWLAEAAAVELFLPFPAVVALVVGSSLIGGDLVAGRLSFYFSRPLSPGALWAGKFLGGAVVVLGTFVLAGVPFVLMEGKDPRSAWPLLLLLLLLLCLMAFAHVAGTMFRSGSRLVALDLGLGTVFATAFALEVRRLAIAGAGRVVIGTMPAALGVATAAMLAAAAAQLAHGRADAHRGHVALSTTLWALAAAALGGFALWGAWLLRATPADVGGVGGSVLAAPRGSALFFKGASAQGRAGFSPVFLMEGESGAYVRLAPERMSVPAFAADGRTAVWAVRGVPLWWYVAPVTPDDAWRGGTLGAPSSSSREALVVARFVGGTPAIEERPLDLPEVVSKVLAVDASGRRALLASLSSVFLVDTTGALIARLPLPDVVAADIRAEDAVRLYRAVAGGGGAFVVEDWSVKDATSVERARLPGDASLRLLARRGDLSVVSGRSLGKALVDAASGGVRRVEAPEPDFPGVALVLGNGSVALSVGGEVRIVTASGVVAAGIPIDPRTRVLGLRETAPGELAVGLWAARLDARRTLFADAATGAISREEPGLLPAEPPWSGLPPAEPGSFASRLFRDGSGALVALEGDGRRREIVAGP